MESISGKEFQKAMQKVKDRGNSAVPPKKSASAYILFGKEVSNNQLFLRNLIPASIEKSRNTQKEPTNEGH